MSIFDDTFKLLKERECAFSLLDQYRFLNDKAVLLKDKNGVELSTPKLVNYHLITQNKDIFGYMPLLASQAKVVYMGYGKRHSVVDLTKRRERNVNPLLRDIHNKEGHLYIIAPKYIKQGEDSTCRVITLLNANVNKFGSSVLDYNTPHYREFIKEYCGGYEDFERGLMVEKTDILEKMLGIKREKFSGKSIADFEKWIRHHLLSGNYIDFLGYVRGLHSFLIVDYDLKYDTFCCINARIYNPQTSVEWLPLPLILNSYTSRKNKPSIYKNLDIGLSKYHKDSTALIFKNQFHKKHPLFL